MAQVKVRLEKEMGTAVLTLFGKAIDARTDPSILHDSTAAEAFDRIDYDLSRLKMMSAKVAPNAAARAKHFDDWTREFLAEHEEATVVHLGAGLDTRVWRVAPGPGVQWYDVDYPDVVEVRRKLYPERENYRMIGCSVTSPEWLEQVPTDLPTLIVAEGLTMYLEPAEGHALLRRITGHFPSGTLALDAHNPLGVRLVNIGLKRMFGAPLLRWGIRNARELELAAPKLRCTDSVSALHAPSSAGLARNARIAAKLSKAFPPLRDIGLYLRYEFGE